MHNPHKTHQFRNLFFSIMMEAYEIWSLMECAFFALSTLHYPSSVDEDLRIKLFLWYWVGEEIIVNWDIKLWKLEINNNYILSCSLAHSLARSLLRVLILCMWIYLNVKARKARKARNRLSRACGQLIAPKEKIRYFVSL